MPAYQRADSGVPRIRGEPGGKEDVECRCVLGFNDLADIYKLSTAVKDHHSTFACPRLDGRYPHMVLRQPILSAILLLGILIPGAASARLPGDLGIGREHARRSARTIRAEVHESDTFRNPFQPTVRGVALDRTFTSRQYGLKMQYPSAWERQDLMQSTPPLTLVVMFLAREERENVRQNVNLVAEELASTMSLAEYTELGIAMEREFFDRYALLRSEDMRIAGVYPGHRVVFTASLNGGDMTFEQVWVLRGRTALVWTFADAADTFEENVKTFERMLDTLTLQ